MQRALLVRAYDGSECADEEGLTPGQRSKLSLEIAGKRATDGALAYVPARFAIS